MSKRVVVSLGALALGLLAGACANPNPQPWNAPLAADLFPITVRQSRSAVEIPVQATRYKLSYVEIDAIRNIGAEYLAAGHGPIVIAAPDGAGNEDAAVVVGAEARDILAAMGIDYAAIQGTAYDATGRTDAPLVVMVDRYVAEATPCFERWADFSRTYSGGNTLNFGCANQANLAAVVTDPADLLGPRDETPSDAGRRSVVLGRYRAGETTITSRGDDEGVSISDAVQ